MNPSVSVVIATYNYGRYLAGALDSGLGQTFRDLEIIVVDDGSTDNTPQLVEPYLRDPRVRYCASDHRGQPVAKNAGLRLARAPLIAFLDADDLWLPTKLEKQVALFQNDPSLGVVYARRLLIDAEGRQLEYQQPLLHRGRVLEQMFRDNFVCFSSAVVRRAVFDEVGLFDEQLPLAIDYDLWLRVGLRYRFDYVNEPLVQYRTGHRNLSQRVEERLATANRIMSRFLDQYGGRAALSPAIIRQACAETFCHMALACRGRSRLAALPWYLRAIGLAPGHAAAWKGLASLPLPESVRRRLRIALGRPADWPMRLWKSEHSALDASIG